MPHWRPRMNASPQITSAEPRIRIPACRSASPKNRKTRRLKTSPMTRAQNFAMSPNDSIQSFGTLSQVLPISQRPERSGSLDHRDLGVGGEQRLREHVVEGEDAQELDDDALVYGSTNPLGASRGGHPLVTRDDRDDRPEQGRLNHRSP